MKSKKFYISDDQHEMSRTENALRIFKQHNNTKEQVHLQTKRRFKNRSQTMSFRLFN